jgi:hypothetical protein
MATPQDFALSNLHSNGAQLMQHLEQANKLRNRIIQELVALTGGTPAGLDAFFSGYTFPNNYTTDDIKSLYIALNGLPGSIVDDGTRDELFTLLAEVYDTFA